MHARGVLQLGHRSTLAPTTCLPVRLSAAAWQGVRRQWSVRARRARLTAPSTTFRLARLVADAVARGRCTCATSVTVVP